MAIFWDMTLCCLVKASVSEERITSIFMFKDQGELCCLLCAGFLLNILFNPEDGGDMFL
jgi:hypothetical protein